MRCSLYLFFLRYEVEIIHLKVNAAKNDFFLHMSEEKGNAKSSFAASRLSTESDDVLKKICQIFPFEPPCLNEVIWCGVEQRRNMV